MKVRKTVSAVRREGTLLLSGQLEGEGKIETSPDAYRWTLTKNRWEIVYIIRASAQKKEFNTEG